MLGQLQLPHRFVQLLKQLEFVSSTIKTHLIVNVITNQSVPTPQALLRNLGQLEHTGRRLPRGSEQRVLAAEKLLSGNVLVTAAQNVLK